MSWNASLTTAQIKAVFTEEIASAGGKVTDTFDDGTLIFSRAVLPQNEEIARKDRVDQGVALKGAWEDLWVHPYIYRRVCINGAIVAQAVATNHVQNTAELNPIEVELRLREAVHTCCTEQDFEGFTDRLKRTRSIWVNPRVDLLPHLSRLPADQAPEIIEEVYRRFTEGADESRYGLINAVTSLARDSRNPDMRWSLEAAGGALMMATTPTEPPKGAGDFQAVPISNPPESA